MNLKILINLLGIVLFPLGQYCKLTTVCLPQNYMYLTVKEGKVFPYSLPSVGPGADPGVQAVSPQVT